MPGTATGRPGARPGGATRSAEEPNPYGIMTVFCNCSNISSLFRPTVEITPYRVNHKRGPQSPAFQWFPCGSIPSSVHANDRFQCRAEYPTAPAGPGSTRNETSSRPPTRGNPETAPATWHRRDTSPVLPVVRIVRHRSRSSKPRQEKHKSPQAASRTGACPSESARRYDTGTDPAFAVPIAPGQTGPALKASCRHEHRPLR